MTIKLVKKSLAIVLLATLAGCTHDFEEINTNPNKTNVGTISSYSMFEPILYGAGKTWQKYTWYWNNELVQFTAFTGGTTRQEHRYFIADQDWSSLWNFYSKYANNTLHMYSLAQQENDKALQAVSLTLKVLFLSNLTDMFGDIPYAEAFLGRDDESKRQPIFDSQKDVYADMFEDLETANQLYSEHPTFINQKLDGMYHGDMAAWQRFSNSLYLRLLCRVSSRNELNAQSKIREILNQADRYPIIRSNEENAIIHFSGKDPYNSYFYSKSTTESDFTSSGRKLTQQFIRMTTLQNFNEETVYQDPRLPIWGKPHPKYQKWKGTVAGCTQDEQQVVDRNTSYLNFETFCQSTSPAFILCYDELLFIQAEAALKSWIDGGEERARAYYEAAITASMEKWSEQGQLLSQPISIATEQIQEFLGSELGSWETSSNKEELIANQKYLALFWEGMEAYHEYRRTGYPVLTIGQGCYNEKVLPTRFAYPAVTVATNSNHVHEALLRMGGENTMRIPVWWSKNAITNNY